MRILRLLLASTAAALALAGCSDDEQAPAPLPDRVQLNAPAKAEVGAAVKLSSTAGTGTEGLRFEWDFGDGSRSDQTQPSHTYAAAGHYEVKLTLRNIDGQSRTATVQVVAGHFARLQGLECNQPGQTGWCWQQPRPRGNAVNAAYFANAQRGWVVGEAGLILRTDDGGANWTAQRSGVDVSLWQVRFSDAQKGYAVGDKATLLRTEDGGESWAKIHVDAAQDLNLRRVLMVDEHTLVLTSASTGLAGYYDPVLTLRDHRLLQSVWLSLSDLQVTKKGSVVALTDGVVQRQDADGWFREVLAAPTGQRVHAIGSGPGGRLWALAYLVPTPSDEPYVGIPEREPDPVQSLTLHFSENEGTTWQAKPVQLPPGAGGVRMYTLRMFEGGAGWAWSGSGRLLHSVDGGLSWTFVELPWQEPLWISAWSTGGWFIDAQTVQIYADGKLWLSVDGAQHWRAMTQMFESFVGTEPITRDGGGGLIRNDWYGRGLSRSLDNGITWNSMGTGPAAAYYESLQTVWFGSDAKRGLVQIQGRPLQETGDGGLLWQPSGPDVPCDYCGQRLSHTQDGTLWLERREGGLSRSTDGGRTWTPLTLTPQLLARYYFSFTSDKVLSAQTPTGIYLSTDGGQRWELLPVVIPDNVRRVTFADAQTGTLISNQGNLWRTGDGGQHWQRVPTESLLVRDGRIHFLDNRTGWILGTQGEVLVTRDGGMSWQNVDLPPHGQMHDLRFVDLLHGWMVGEQGLIFATVDGGKTWVSQRSGTERALWSVWAIDADTVWVSGEGGTLLTSSSGGR